MAERRELLKVSYISDHSCGNYQLGEIDTMSDDAVLSHINTYGQYGYEQVRDFAIRMLLSAENVNRERIRSTTSTCANGLSNSGDKKWA